MCQERPQPTGSICIHCIVFDNSRSTEAGFFNRELFHPLRRNLRTDITACRVLASGETPDFAAVALPVVGARARALWLHSRSSATSGEATCRPVVASSTGPESSGTEPSRAPFHKWTGRTVLRRARVSATPESTRAPCLGGRWYRRPGDPVARTTEN